MLGFDKKAGNPSVRTKGLPLTVEVQLLQLAKAPRDVSTIVKPAISVEFAAPMRAVSISMSHIRLSNFNKLLLCVTDLFVGCNSASLAHMVSAYAGFMMRWNVCVLVRGCHDLMRECINGENTLR